MPTRLLLLLCLFGQTFGKKPPDVDCVVVHLEYVSCMWNQEGPPEVNYTFFSRFYHEKVKQECPTYLSENNVNIGCHRPYKETQRYNDFTTELVHGKEIFSQLHRLKQKVRLNPPTNLTVLYGSDQNLWFYWNQIPGICVESQVRHRKNNKKWSNHFVSYGINKYCINLPSNNSQYELQVQSRIGDNCGQSLFWSNWSEPVIWGSNNSTAVNQMSVWTPVLYVVGVLTLILLGAMLLHIERFRVILIPVVPKPLPISHDIEDWFQFPKGLKESFKDNFNEPACPVREYRHVSQSDSESCDSSDSSGCSVTTDQTDCSVSIPANEPKDLSTALSSSASTVTCEEEKLQESV